jgi:hypothetical protein
MRKRQRGITTLGLIIMLAILGLIGFGVLQMVPVYLENMKLVSLLKQVKIDHDGQNASLSEIKNTIYKRIDVEDLRGINMREDFVFSRSPNGYLVSIEYSRKKTFVANVYLLAEFDHSVEITR